MLTTWRHYPRPTAITDLDPKLSVDCWSPAVYPAGCQRRQKAAVDAVTCLVLDFDDGTRMEEAAVVYQNFDHIGHSSWSHAEDHHKFRLILPLAQPVPGPEWPRAWQWVIADWQARAPETAGRPDPACKDASRLYFLPAIRPGAPRESWVHEGYYGPLSLPWQIIPERRPPPITPLRPVLVCTSRAEREIQRRLNTEPVARRELGRVLSGAVGVELVRYVRCPGCGRLSVWWSIHPDRRRTAACNHRSTCGWWGWLFDLAVLSGLSVERAA